MRTLKPRSSRSKIRTDITLRSVRSLRPDKALQLPSASLGFMGQSRPTSLPSLGGSAVRVPIPLGSASRSFDYSDRVTR